MNLHKPNLLRAIGLKILSALLFALMSGFVRQLGQVTPVGEMVFFRSAFAIPPLVIIYALRGQFLSMLYTSRPFGQLGRGILSITGMFTNFSALTRLPIADATAIGFAAPLITVAMAAVILKEKVRVFRWTAVAVGFIGVIVMLLPHLNFEQYAAGATATIGAGFAIASAFCTGGTIIQTRRLTQSETTQSIVFYFSLVCTLMGAMTLPFAWYTPTPYELFMLISIGVLGGLAHIFLTESYRYAAASVIAPFDYTALIWALLIGYWMFGELPDIYVYLGSSIVVAAGMFVIWRERQLARARILEERSPSP